MVSKKNPSDEKKFAVPEIDGVRTGINAPTFSRFATFPALQNRNYRIYFAGQFVSVIGTWIQIVAQGWLVLQITNSAFLLGLVAALTTLPSLLFSLFGGVIVDRFNKKHVLYFTQFANMLLALTLGLLVTFNVVSIVIIGTIAFLMGTVNAVDAPARQAFVSTVVNKEQLPSAIALNSGIFNAARAIGPAIAGLLIAFAGAGVAFIINGISYGAVLFALGFIHYEYTKGTDLPSPINAIAQGVSYAFRHPVIKVLIVFTGVLSIFGWSYSTMMPVIAKNVMGVEAQGLGYMYTATGLGSLLATYLVGAHSKRIKPVVFIMAGNVIFACSLILFSYSRHMYIALPLLFLIGLGLLCQAATINTIIQTVVKNEYRGRVMSLYVLMFLGVAPVGNFEIGYVSEHFTISAALRINAVIVAMFGLLVFLNRTKIIKAYEHYSRVQQP